MNSPTLASHFLLPDLTSAFLALLGALPADDAFVLGQSGPHCAPEKTANLTALRIQQSYLCLLAVAPVWSALLQQPAAQAAILQAFAQHPWRPLLDVLLPAWREAVGTSSSDEPDLEVALSCWRRLHDQHWQALKLPPISPMQTVLPSLPTAAVPLSWQRCLQAWAIRAGQLAARCRPSLCHAQPGLREVVWQREDVTLYRYPAAEDAPAILLVYAWINRPEVLDLSADQSLIASLQQQGLAVWLLDWSQAGATGTTLDEYVLTHVDAAVTTVATQSATKKTALLGICQGGTLALTYACLKPARVSSLSLVVTPVDFQTSGDRLSAWTQHLPSAPLASLMAHAPGLINLAFLQLKPFSLRVGKYLALLMQDPTDAALAAFLRMEHWLLSGPLLSGAGLAAYLERYYHQNGLCTNTLEIAGQPVRLGQLVLPVQLLIAEQDHIVPPPSSEALCTQLPTAVTVARFQTGHIGLLVGRARAQAAVAVAGFVQQHLAQVKN